MTEAKGQTDTKRNVVIYCRVGTPAQKDTGALEKQESLCRAYAAEQDCNVAHCFCDISSGRSLNRPGIEYMSDFLRVSEAPIQSVIIRDQAIATRDIRCRAKLRQKLREMGVAIESPSQGCGEAKESFNIEQLQAAIYDLEENQLTKPKQ